ncbi:sulfotransferase [Sulfurimonas sp. SWIR-19]|uniref:sulfotransferase domain-containing protein n=1 Tax=Sulfurimonas sp. SWIR-19 TaxID=2878390 RepID=UPI001CF14618|nr:sulfotransferase domain-containing protein [Sulfurimonas sp. SWIR-19]UCN00599.1 sulfotransferase [Sulfurimonas sp. SWIR-19]
MKKVDFLIVGTQKSATSALFTQLAKHPKIEMSRQKELHFFDTDIYFKHKKPDYEKYHSYFSDKEKLWGEATPIYAYWEEAPKRIYEYNKKIKLIFILRDPIERAFSQWNMEKNRDTEHLSFSQALREEEQRVKEALPEQHRVYSYKDRGLYSLQIRRLLRFFSKEQILFLCYEDLKNYPILTLNKVTDFLQIEVFESLKFDTVFQTAYKSQLLYSDFLYLKKYFYNDVQEVQHLLGWKCSSWLKRKKNFKVLFYRDYRAYTGGHQVVYDYFSFFKEHPLFEVFIYFSKESCIDATNPWYNDMESRVEVYEPWEYDVLFIAGEDWKMLEDGIENYKTVINLIQGIRHTFPQTKLYKYLQKKAYKIAVSNEVANALCETQKVLSPIVTIENGIDLSNIEAQKEFEVYILGVKNVPLARELAEYFDTKNISFEVTYTKKSLQSIHTLMAKAKISVLLPFHAEGFYLPALEAMQYTDLVVVPDCIGNRTFCKNDFNVIMPPEYDFESLVVAIEKAFCVLNDNERLEEMQKNMTATYRSYSKEKQKKLFYDFLEKNII